MKGQPKKRKYVGFMRSVLAQNVRALIDHHYKDSDNRPKALATDTGLSLSSVQRVLNAEAGASIDTIEVIANAFDLSTYHLVLPNLDVQNPQIVAGASSAERAMYAQFRRGHLRMENQDR
jgi:transcriptional regulator with XRE-family HTH domain